MAKIQGVSAARYLSGADREAQFFGGAGLFERELLRQILFQPDPLVLTDIFCFFPVTAEHVLQPKRSLLSRALQAGHVRVARRDPTTETFMDLLESLGPAVGVDLERAREVAHRLDAARKAGDGFRWVDWPAWLVSGAFRDRLSQTFALETEQVESMAGGDPGIRHELRHLWEETRDLRALVLDEAPKRSDEDGVRRADVLSVLADHFGVGAVSSIDELDARVPEGRRRRGMVALWKWVVEVYQVNQAAAFGCAPTFSTFDHRSLPVLGAVAWADHLGEEPPERLRLDLRLPSGRSLGRLSSQAVWECRVDVGERFFAAVGEWAEEPDARREARVREAAKAYGEALVEVTRPKTVQDVVAEVWPGACRPTGAALVELLLAGDAAGAGIHPLVSTFGSWALGPLARGLVLWRAHFPTTERVRLEIEARHPSQAIINLASLEDGWMADL